MPALECRKVEYDPTAGDLAVINAHACTAVGHLEGEPVTASAALPVEGNMYIAPVNTMPGQCAKGFAEASIRHTVQHAQAIMAAIPLTLHASDAGRPCMRRWALNLLRPSLCTHPTPH